MSILLESSYIIVCNNCTVRPGEFVFIFTKIIIQLEFVNCFISCWNIIYHQSWLRTK